jgi:hypothetical protein
MKYNPNDIVLLHYRTETKVAIIQEKHYVGVKDKKHQYIYLVLMCGISQPVPVRGEQVIEKIYPANNNQYINPGKNKIKTLNKTKTVLIH